MANEVYIGRQPIFNRKLKTTAYELLYRDTEDNRSELTGDAATSRVIINAFIEIGLENVIGPHDAFFKLTRGFLMDQELGIFPPERTVFEVPSDIEVDEALIEAIKGLKSQGYRIALDNFVIRKEILPLLAVTDIVKIDTSQLDEEQIRKHVEVLKPKGIKLLAQKVETPEQFNLYQDLGIDFFQGYFFAKPTVVKSKRVPANKMTVMQLLARVNDPDVTMDELAELIQQDVSLSVKVLKYVNSPITGLSREIDSIQRALILLGVDMIKYWVSIMAMSDLASENTPDELITTLLARARSCELLAKRTGAENPAAYFTVGLFSALDVVMETEMETVLAQLPLVDEVKQALLHLKGDMGQALRCTMALESGLIDEAAFHDLDSGELARINREAMQWADEVRAHAA